MFQGGHFSSQTLRFFPLKRKDTLPETNKLPMKMEGWKREPSLEAPRKLHQIYPHQRYGLIEGFLIIGFPE